MNYSMTWRNRYDVDMHLYIVDTVNKSSENITLTPASSPFTTHTEFKRESLVPVIKGNAVIRCIGNYSMLNELFTGSSTRFRVVLESTYGNLEWLGWIKSETRTQNFCNEMSEIEIQCIDDVAAMDYYKLSWNSWIKDNMSNDPYEFDCGGGFCLMRTLLAECLCHTEGHYGDGSDDMKRIIFGENISVVRDGIENVLLNYKIARVVYFDEDDNDDTHQHLYTGKTCTEFVEDFCKMFGLTLYQNGPELVFDCDGDPADIRYYSTTVYDLYYGNHIEHLHDGAASEKDINLLKPRNRNHRFSVISSPSVAITTRRSDTHDIFLPSLNKNERIGSIAYDPVNITRPRTGKWVARELLADGVDCHSYLFTEHSNWQDYSSVPFADRLKMCTAFGVGAVVVSDDYWGFNGFERAEDHGSSTLVENKGKYNFAKRVMLTPCTYPQLEQGSTQKPVTRKMSDMPLLVMRGVEEVSLAGGGLCISMNMHHKWISNSPERCDLPMMDDITSTAISGDYRSLPTYLLCSLRIGNKYLTHDRQWSDDPTSMFYITTESQGGITSYAKVNDTNTLKNMIDADGFVINIPSAPMTGVMEFSIYNGFKYDAASVFGETNLPVGKIIISDIKIERVNSVDYDLISVDAIINQKDEYKISINENHTEEETAVDIIMHSMKDGVSDMAAIFDNSKGKFTTGLETNLSSVYSDIFRFPRTFLEINTEPCDDLKKPYLSLYRIGGMFRTMGCKSCDWRTMEANYILSEIV